MEFNNFVINDLASYRMHFSFPELLDVISSRAVLLNWLVDIQKLSYIDDDTRRMMSEIYDNLKYMDKTESIGFCRDKMLFQPFRNEVSEKCTGKFQRFCVVLDGMMRLAEYTPTDEDYQGIHRLMISERIIEEAMILHIEVINGNPVLYCDKTSICQLPKGGKQCVTSVSDPYSGTLGIAKDGSLINHTAFHIAQRKKHKAVKVQLNLMRYAVLYDDGVCIHNLPFSGTHGKVKNIQLNHDELCCTPA